MALKSNRIHKILVLGDSGVGKSTLIKSYFNERFTNSYQATIGVDFCTKHVNINDRIVRVQIWDTAGMERFLSITTSMFRGTDCCVLVYDVSSSSSFTNLEMWHSEFLKQVNPMDTARIPFVVIGNKADLGQYNVSAESVRNWCQLNNNIPHFEVSANDGRRVEDAFKIAAKLALDYAEEQDDCCNNPIT
ncbi:ras-related protein Rab7-like isoform X2 [Drosophila hydei]|uniref:Ras-related protein Rab-7b n=1 Tax=Drosophila hydei TaxID=7224 RepID=A0A6J2SR42_DROHY|nr:ras-related protein Rab7-like isoform X2 [Drosophila hydei]